jgi:hypothetical protein
VAGLSRTSSPIPNLCDSHVRRPTTPPAEGRRFGLFPFRSPLLRESLLLSLPQGTKMFQFPWYAPIHPMDSGGGTGSSSRWVAPFGDPRITACLRLPEAFRSSPRPSSAPGAKASTVRPFQLHLRSCSSSSVLFRCYRDLAFIPYLIFKVRFFHFVRRRLAATYFNIACPPPKCNPLFQKKFSTAGLVGEFFGGVLLLGTLPFRRQQAKMVVPSPRQRMIDGSARN